MSSLEILDKRFIIEKDGGKDIYYGLLGSCFQQCLYLIGKCENQEMISKIFYNLFVDDINLIIEVDENAPIAKFNVNSFSGCYGVFNLRYYEKKGEQAVSLLENLLDEGKIVAVDTLLQQAKFSQKYTPDFVYTSQSSGHIFTAVAHDKKYFYITDNIDFIKTDVVKSYPSNDGIYMIDKEYMMIPFSCYCIFWTANLDLQKTQKSFYDTAYMQSILNDVVSSYKKKNCLENDRNVLYGRNAIVYLIEMCKLESFNIETAILPGTTVSVYGQILWQLGYLFYNRMIFLEFLKRNFKDVYENQQFIDVFESALRRIDLLKNTLIIRHIRNISSFDKGVEKLLLSWLESDDTLFKMLNDLI